MPLLSVMSLTNLRSKQLKKFCSNSKSHGAGHHSLGPSQTMAQARYTGQGQQNCSPDHNTAAIWGECRGFNRKAAHNKRKRYLHWSSMSICSQMRCQVRGICLPAWLDLPLSSAIRWRLLRVQEHERNRREGKRWIRRRNKGVLVSELVSLQKARHLHFRWAEIPLYQLHLIVYCHGGCSDSQEEWISSLAAEWSERSILEIISLQQLHFYGFQHIHNYTDSI